MAENHNKRMEPHTKTHLLKNLQRKMRSFQRKLEHLPLVLDVDTDSKSLHTFRTLKASQRGLMHVSIGNETTKQLSTWDSR